MAPKLSVVFHLHRDKSLCGRPETSRYGIEGAIERNFWRALQEFGPDFDAARSRDAAVGENADPVSHLDGVSGRLAGYQSGSVGP